MTDNVIKHERNFSHLLEDSLAFLIDADDKATEKKYEAASRCAKASIFNTLFMYECVANCCLASLDLSRGMYSKIERMDTLSKYEFYLILSTENTKLDRSVVEIERVNELKKLRDNLAHPKITKISYQLSNSKDSILSYEPKLNKTDKLNLPTDMSRWYVEEALVASKALNEFLNYFFLNLCKINCHTVASLLFGDKNPKEHQYSSMFITTTNNFKVAHNKWGIELNYIGIRY